jgi:hypothetical protein
MHSFREEQRIEWNERQIGELKAPENLHIFNHNTDFLCFPCYAMYVSIKHSGQSRLNVLFQK